MVDYKVLKRLWPALLLILIGFGLRVYKLDYPDITGDEAWSITIAGWPLSDVVSSDTEFNPPLYHIFLYAMMRLGGNSTFSFRYLSVIAGLLGIVVLGRLGALVGGRRLGWLTLFVGVFSPFLVYYAQEARFYSLVLFTSAASFTISILILRGQRDGQPVPVSFWLLYGLTSLLMLFTHYFAFAMLSTQAAFVIPFHAWRRVWRKLRNWILVWLGLAVVYLPWMGYSIDFLNTRTEQRYEEWNLTRWLEITQRTLKAFSASITVPANLIWISWLIVGLVLVGALSLWRYRPRQRYLPVFALVVLLGGICFAWVMTPILPFFYERYLMVATPAFVLLLAAGIWGSFKVHWGSGLLAVVLLLAVSAVSLWHQWFDPFYLKSTYGRMIAGIEGQFQDGDLLLLQNPLQESLAKLYIPPEFPSLIVDRARLLTAEDTAVYLSSVTTSYDRIWLVEHGNPQEYDPTHRVQRWLGQHGSRAHFENVINSGPAFLFILDGEATGEERLIQANLANQVLLATAQLPGTAAPGEPLFLELTWEALTSIDRDFTVFTHLLNEDGLLVAQSDSQPGGGANPTSTWQPGQAVKDKYAILVPAESAPGRYRVRVGMYLWPELTRLPVITSQTGVFDNAIDLGFVSVN